MVVPLAIERGKYALARLFLQPIYFKSVGLLVSTQAGTQRRVVLKMHEADAPAQKAAARGAGQRIRTQEENRDDLTRLNLGRLTCIFCRAIRLI